MSFIVNAPVINLYSYPKTSCDVVSQALYGWEVNSLSEQGLFHKIQTFDGYKGWVLSKDLIPKRDLKLSSQASIAKTIHNAVHVYALPDVTKQKPLMTLPFEVLLEVISEPEEENFRWIQVKLVNDRLAWIQRYNVILHPSVLTFSEVVKLSKQFLGLPYTWGGISSFGYDCSGFMQMLFRQMGIQLLRDASQQIEQPVCQPIEISRIVAGDLIFFKSSHQKTTHVGLFLGSQEMIHATAREIPIVQITHLDDPCLKQRYPYRIAKRIQLTT